MKPPLSLRGLALLELLVATGLLAVGVASLLQLHRQLQLGTELSRQRADAVQAAADDLEQLRWLSHDGSQDTVRWQDITDVAPHEVSAASAPTVLWHERHVDTVSTPALKTVLSTVRWQGRDGQAHALTLPSLLAGQDPRWSAVSLLSRTPLSGVSPPGTTPPSTPRTERSVRIPVASQNLGDGRHAFKPRVDDGLVWLFNSDTAEVIGRCNSAKGIDNRQLSAASLGACRGLSGVLLSGFVRFATDSDSLSALDAEQPRSPAMSLGLKLTLSTTNHPTPAWECTHDGPVGVPPGTTAQRDIRWYCVIQPVAAASGGAPRWSGRLDLVPQGWGWASSGVTPSFRACRYSADQDGNGRIDNSEHPASYSVVTSTLSNQNFLIIRAAARCPADTRPLTRSHPVNLSTVQHQP